MLVEMVTKSIPTSIIINTFRDTRRKVSTDAGKIKYLQHSFVSASPMGKCSFQSYLQVWEQTG